MSTAGPSTHRTTSRSRSPMPSASPRYHPYTHHPTPPAAPAHSQKHRRTHPPAAHGHPGPDANGEYPPSPPRSRRDPSETPSVSLSMAFGAASGGKWWDEELPPPPASLTSILDSFRRSGEGDRELLLTILGAKKAEEERLSAMIHTRLTILQARLSFHSAAAAAMPLMPMTMPPVFPSDLPPHPHAPAPAHASPHHPATHLHPHAQAQAQGYPRDPRPTSTSPPPPAIPAERTPSLTSSRGSASSTGVTSPPPAAQAGYMQPPPAPAAEKERERSERAERAERGEREGMRYWQLPSLQSSLRGTRSDKEALPPLRERERAQEKEPRRGSGSISPGTGRDRAGSGLEMLLDVGMGRLAEGERRE
ncbi:hypothetical protein IAT38_002412 [Cryptococcus sp. DSM 104549]